MTPHVRAYALRCVLLVGAMYMLARLAGWTGPGNGPPLVPELLWPGIGLITLWGLWRLLGRLS